jgi:dTDP-4-dehydrorhamnose reductase
MKRILVLGASGMAGHTITLYFNRRGYSVTTISRMPIEFHKGEKVVLDVFEIEKLKDLITAGNFDVIINCIGILNEYAEKNKGEAVFLNSYLPHFLVDATKNTKTKIIHMSTDCVFSGEKGQYKEYDFRDGVTFYDRSKALGEIDNDKDLTFRNSIIGPDINRKGIGLFNWFMKQEGPIRGFTKAMWTGVTTLTLAKAMEAAIEQNLAGIYNLVNNESISKYDLLKLFNKYFRNNQVKISEFDGFISDKSLVRTRTDFNFEVPSYEQMIKEMYEWVLEHKHLYEDYDL